MPCPRHTGNVSHILTPLGILCSNFTCLPERWSEVYVLLHSRKIYFSEPYIRIRFPEGQEHVVFENVVATIVGHTRRGVAYVVFKPLVGRSSVVVETVFFNKYPVVLEIICICAPSVAP